MNHSTAWSSNDVGGLCWVSDPAQAYIEARVESVSGGVVTAKAADGRTFAVDLQLPLQPPSRKQKEPPRRILQRVPLTTNNGVENMDNLQTLHEAAILDNIQHRFRMDLIYTNTGPILIAMNPFKWLPIYGDDVISRYHGRPYGALPPHCFQEAEDAFASLQKTRRNQAIVICGESGAGKTETTKLMLHYLAVVSKRTSTRDAKLKGGCSGGTTIAERMVASNPLLEAFGNAKTLRNDNSSRFGKFTRFDFQMNSSIINGGHIENLLLEKVRVVEQGSGERNYHVFYQLCAAAKAGKLPGAAGAALAGAAGDAAAHAYTRGCVTVDDMDDLEEFGATVAALDALGVRGAELEAIFRAAAAVYVVGDVAFVADGQDGSKVSPATQGALDTASKLLGVDAAALATALTHRVRETPEGSVTSPNDPAEATTLRHALAKSVFSKLFDWLVQRANAAFDVSAGRETQFIGVLDIFGFEDMATNGFEQVFINTTNEQLQKVFNDLVFEAEAEEYTREQIEWDKTAFPDNTPCIEMLTKRPTGILRLVDSECTRGHAASDGAKLVAKVNKAHAKSPFFEVCGPASVWRRKDGSRTEDSDFLVHHFAGPIVYTVASFVDKNRDALFGHVHDALHASSDALVSSCFPPREDAGASKKMTVANKYLSQLASLTGTLRESSTRFVRCIKTNSEKLPQKLDKPAVLGQLVCSGVMAALEVRRAGFPTRVLYREFVREFRAFTPRGAAVADPKALCAAMMQHPHVRERVPTASYRLGVSKLFMQSEVLYTLQSIRNAMLYPFVRRLQRWWIKLQGSILQRKLKRCGADLEAARAEASIKGVAAVAAVRDVLAEAETARAAAAAAPSAEAIAPLRAAVAKAGKVVAAAVAKKEEAYRIRAEFLAEIDDAYSRCKALRAVANGLYAPRDAEGLGKACGGAEAQLGACRAELLTVASAWDQGVLALSGSQGPHSLRRAGTMASMRNVAAATQHVDTHEARRARLDAALGAVREAEALSARLLEKQRLLDEARREFQAALDGASERLAVIPVEQFIIQGIRAVSDAVVAARDAIFAAQKALQSPDPDPVRAAVAAATDAVDAALARAESEALRLRAMTDLDECERTLGEVGHQVHEGGFGDRLDDLLRLGEKAISDARDRSSDPDVALLVRATRGAVDAVNHAGEQLEREQERKRAEEKARFNKLLGRFQRMDEANAGGGVPKFARKAGGAAPKPLFKVKRVSAAPADAPPPAPPPARPSAKPVARAPAAPARSVSPPTAPSVKALAPTNAPRAPPATPPAKAPPPTPTSACPTPAGGHTLESWISQKNLGKYEAKLRDLAGDIHDLLEMTDADADELIADCGMPKLAARRFKKALLELGAPVHA